MGKGIVFAPLRVCRHVWPFEGGGWPHLSSVPRAASRQLRACHGSKVDAYMLEGDTDLVCLNYESIPWLVKAFPFGVPGRNVLICR